MCQYDIISNLYKTEKSTRETIYKQMLENRTENPDGTGIYAFNNKTKEAEIWKFYGKEPDGNIQEVLDLIEKEIENYTLFIMHNRLGTSGNKGLSQCHPLPIIHCDENGKNQLKGWFAFHNGIIFGYEARDAENLSDTQIMAYDMGQWIYDHDIKKPSDFANGKWKKYWESKFSGSKVTIVHGDEFYTINANLGVKEDGIWKSSSAKKPKIVYYNGNPYSDYYGGCGYYDDSYEQEKWDKAIEKLSYNPDVKPTHHKLTKKQRKALKKRGWTDQELDEVDIRNGFDVWNEECQGVPDYDPTKKAS